MKMFILNKFLPFFVELFIRIVIRLFKSEYIKSTIASFINGVIHQEVKNEADKTTAAKKVLTITVDEISKLSVNKLEEKYK